MIADTSFLVDLARGDPGARAALASIEEGSEALRIPAPALAKLWEAVERSRRPPREVLALQSLLLGVPSAPFEARHAIAAGRLLGAAAARGDPLDPLDAMVAAIALVEDEALLTRSLRDFGNVADLRTRPY